MKYTISSLDFASISGVSPYDSPVSLFLKKTGKIEKDKEETFLMTLGKKMEKVHRELLQEKGIVVISGEFNLRKHPQREEFIAVPDGFTHYHDGVRVVENKTVLRGEPNIIFYETQLLWEMLVCQCNGLLTILTPNDLIIKEYDRNPEWENEAIKLADNFLQLLEKNEMPSIENYHPADYPALLKIKRKNENVIDIDIIYEKICQQIIEYEKESKRLEEAIKFMKSQLLAIMKENKKGICGKYKLNVISQNIKPYIRISNIDNDITDYLDKLGYDYKLHKESNRAWLDIDEKG